MRAMMRTLLQTPVPHLRIFAGYRPRQQVMALALSRTTGMFKTVRGGPCVLIRPGTQTDSCGGNQEEKPMIPRVFTWGPAADFFNICSSVASRSLDWFTDQRQSWLLD